MNTIISKRPTAFVYTKWHHDSSGSTIQTPEYSIIIYGGAGVQGGADFGKGKHEKNYAMFTPEGVATIVDDKTLKKLYDIPKFKKDIDRGLIKVIQNKSIKDQERIDEIADGNEMIRNSDIGGRPITKEEMEKAGAIENDDGSWDVSKGNGDITSQRKTKMWSGEAAKKRGRLRK